MDFYGPEWQFSLPFHILQLVKFLPFEAWKRYPLRAGCTVTDPDLQIRGGGGGRSFRPWDKGGEAASKNFFPPFGPQFGLKRRGARAPPLNPPQASPCRPFWGVPPSEGDTRVSAALPVFSPILLPTSSQRTVFKTDTSVKWTPRVGPFLSLLTLFDSL